MPDPGGSFRPGRPQPRTRMWSTWGPLCGLSAGPGIREDNLWRTGEILHGSPPRLRGTLPCLEGTPAVGLKAPSGKCRYTSSQLCRAENPPLGDLPASLGLSCRGAAQDCPKPAGMSRSGGIGVGGVSQTGRDVPKWREPTQALPAMWKTLRFGTNRPRRTGAIVTNRSVFANRKQN